MCIDWDIMRYAFVISREYGGAKILKVPPGIQFAIGPEDMIRFRLVDDEVTGLTEVALDLTFQSETENLGVTDQVDEARRWVSDANELLQRAKKRRGLWAGKTSFD
jgi:hypothetical protein